MTLFLAVTGIFMYFKQSLAGVIFMNLFMVAVQLSAVGIIWIYIPEVANDE